MSDHFVGKIKWSTVDQTIPQLKLKFLVDVVKNKNTIPDPTVLSVTQRGITIKDTSSGVGQQSSDYSKYQTVNKGDFVMNHMDLLTGYIDIAKHDGVTSPDYRVFKVKSEKVLPDFLLKLFQCFYKLKIFYGFGQGVSMFGRWRMVDTNFQNLKVPVPPIDVQKKILNIVQTEENQYKNKLEKIEKQTELLNKYNQSYLDKLYLDLIEHPDTKMTKLKYIAEFVTGNSLNSKQKEMFSEEVEDFYPYISTENINMENEEINYNGKFKIPKNESKFRICPINTILFCTEGGSYGKKFQITDREVCFVNKLCSIQSNLDSEFLYRFFMTTVFKNEYYPRRNGLIEGVNMFEMGEIKVPVTSYQNQRNLLSQLNKKYIKFNSVIKKNKQAKELLINIHFKKTLQILCGNLT